MNYTLLLFLSVPCAFILGFAAAYYWLQNAMDAVEQSAEDSRRLSLEALDAMRSMKGRIPSIEAEDRDPADWWKA